MAAVLSIQMTRFRGEKSDVARKERPSCTA
jgi:hypothetical protein